MSVEAKTEIEKNYQPLLEETNSVEASSTVPTNSVEASSIVENSKYLMQNN